MADNFKILLEIQVKDRSQAAQKAAQRVNSVTQAVSLMDKQISLWTQKRTGQEFMRFGNMMSKGLINAVKSAGDLERQYVSLAFAMDEDVKSGTFRNFTSDLTKLGLELGQTKREIIDFAREVFQAGADSEETAIKAVRAIALYQSASGMATKELAQNVMKINAQFGRMGGEGITNLLNTIVMASKKLPATPGFIQDALQYVGSMADIAGFTESQITSLLGVIALSTKSSSKVANVVNRTLRNLGNMKNKHLLTSLLGMSEEEVEAMIEGKSGMMLALQKLLGAIKAAGTIPKASGILSNLGINAGLDAASLFTVSKELDTLNKVIFETQESLKYYDPTLELAGENLATFAGQSERLSEAFTNISDSLGRQFIPEAKIALGLLNSMADSISVLSPELQKMVGFLSLAGGGFISLFGLAITAMAQFGLARTAIVQTLGAYRDWDDKTQAVMLNKFGHKPIALVGLLGREIMRGPVSAINTMIKKLDIFSIGWKGLMAAKSGAKFIAKMTTNQQARGSAASSVGNAVSGFFPAMLGRARGLFPLIKGIASGLLRFGRFFISFGVIFTVVQALLRVMGTDLSGILNFVGKIFDIIVDSVAWALGTLVNLMIHLINLQPFGKELTWRSSVGEFSDNTGSIRHNIADQGSNGLEYLPDFIQAKVKAAAESGASEGDLNRIINQEAANLEKSLKKLQREEESAKKSTSQPKVIVDVQNAKLIDENGEKRADLIINLRQKYEKVQEYEKKKLESSNKDLNGSGIPE